MQKYQIMFMQTNQKSLCKFIESSEYEVILPGLRTVCKYSLLKRVGVTLIIYKSLVSECFKEVD